MRKGVGFLKTKKTVNGAEKNKNPLTTVSKGGKNKSSLGTVSKKKKDKSTFFCYKNRPLVRHNDIIYYGNMNEGVVVKLRVKSAKKIKGLAVSESISIQLIDTDPAASCDEQILRASEKEGLYQALDVSSAWLDKYVSLQENI